MKQFCIHGHDTLIYGRYPSGYCKKCGNVKSLKWKKANPKIVRRMRRKLMGCINCPDEPENQKCMICGVIPKTALCADHIHDSGSWRGWLCRNCNLGIGYFQDDPKLLKKAAKYLSSNSVNNQLIQ